MSPDQIVGDAREMMSLALVLTSLVGPWSTPIAMAAPAHSPGCAANVGTYPGSRSTDCVALSNDTVFVDHTVRSPSGKPDYRWAKETALAELR